MYADDLMIMIDSINKMKEALKLCELFGSRMEIKFNPKKTQIMAIGGIKVNETIKLCETEIE